MVKRGSIILIIGPMYSGKTTELLKLVSRYQIAKKRCLVVKSEMDNRYTDGSMIITHNK